jgi:hypothetical protein
LQLCFVSGHDCSGRRDRLYLAVNGPTKEAAEKHRGSPEGTVESSPGRQSWEVTCSTSSPEGTAENRLRPHPGRLSAFPSGLPRCFSAASKSYPDTKHGFSAASSVCPDKVTCWLLKNPPLVTGGQTFSRSLVQGRLLSPFSKTSGRGVPRRLHLLLLPGDHPGRPPANSFATDSSSPSATNTL